MTKTWFLLALLSCFTAPAVFAGQVDNLYQVTVPSDGAADKWQQLAFKQVLAKVTGKSDISSIAAIDTEIQRPSAYIKQYEVIRHPAGNKMRVLLDAARINQLLQENKIAVWGSLRPDILVWLVSQNGVEREFVRQADSAFNIALQQSFSDAGLPLLRPLYDMDDVLQLSPTDVWAGFWQQINQASQRYNADETIAATLDRVMQDDKLMWRLSWQRQQDNRVFRDEVSAEDELSLMQQFSLVLSSQLADRYASLMSTDSATELLIEVQQLTDLVDIVQVQRLLQQIVGVSQVTISRYDTQKAHYRLTSQINADALMSALRFNPRFKMLDREDVGFVVDATSQPVLATLNYLRP